jgi:peroxiredoxin
MRYFYLTILLLALLLVSFSGSNLIGTKAPEWHNSQWFNSEPLKLSDLKGKVILLRFFMESSCPMCRASAPYLNEFHARYKDRGLVVIGMYTPKPVPRKTDLDTVKHYVRNYGFQFPVAIDDDWATLNAFWLNRVPDADFTSVSFLIDRKGIIHHIHPGGTYSEHDAGVLRQQIENLIQD